MVKQGDHIFKKDYSPWYLPSSGVVVRAMKNYISVAGSHSKKIESQIYLVSRRDAARFLGAILPPQSDECIPEWTKAVKTRDLLRSQPFIMSPWRKRRRAALDAL